MSVIDDSLWRLECRLNRPLRSTHLERASFAAHGASEDVWSAEAPERIAPELCVVLSTHRRAASCLRLLEALDVSLAESGVESAFVIVVNDPSDADYAPVLSLLEARFPKRFAFYEASRWLGKHGYWQVYQLAFDLVRRLGPQRTLFLQDDLSFVRGANFVRDTLGQWDSIRDARKAVLYLCAMPDDEPYGRWVRYRRVPAGAPGLWRTQWFDLQAFLAGEHLFQTLGHRILPVPEARWRSDPARSSGVGEQLTRRLFRRGNIYQVQQTAVFHGAEPSVMNAQARALRSLDNRD